MEGGMSYADVERAVPVSASVVSDPPVQLDLDLARKQIEALDGLPRPTLVTCRTGPRSALIYLYAGLQDGHRRRTCSRAPRRTTPRSSSRTTFDVVANGLEQLS